MEQALPRRTAGIPRTWALCMASENHGTVGKAGDPFSHAPGKHERVQVVEIVAAGTPIAPDVDLAGLVCIDVADLIVKLGEVHTWARNLPIPTVGASSAMRKVSEVKEALAATPVAAPTGQVAAPKDDLQQVIAFLMGDAELEGVSFGERHPTKAGAFWWRLNLRAAMHKAAGARAA